MTRSERPSAPEPLRSIHVLAGFDCGVPALDDWLKRRAMLNELGGASRTFVVALQDQVIGYYSLAAASISHSVATSKSRRNMPDPRPAVLIGRLAVDRARHGSGLGGDMLRDAVVRVAGAAGTIGVRTILVHAISEEAKAFYERFGFRPSAIEPLTLMITIEEVLRSLGG